MNKYLSFLILFFVFSISSTGRDFETRRISEISLQEKFFNKSISDAEIIQGLSAYDKMQAKLNAGRLYIRDTFIFE